MGIFMEKLQDTLTPIAYKLDANRYLTAIKSGFFGAMSLLILGSAFLLITEFPLPGYPEFMEGFLGEGWRAYFMRPYNMTMEIITPFVMVGMAKSLCKHYEVDDIGGILLALVAFLILTPNVFTAEESMAIPVDNLSASGMFVGMMSTIVAVEIYRYIIQKGWIVKMPDSVPPNVARSFSALIPGLFVIGLFNILQVLFSLTTFETVHNFIFQILQQPLQQLGNTLIANIVMQLFALILWFFGIHGTNIMMAVSSPIMSALRLENAQAYAAGEPLPNLFAGFINYVQLGGTGATIGLALVVFFFAKSKQYKTLGKLSLGPAIFNINEPLFFGVPLVLNPTMLIPLLLAPITMVVLTYIILQIGLVPYSNGATIPWTTPPIASGFLIAGWRGAVWQAIQIPISAAIYYPFFKIVDKKAYLTETEGEEAVEEIEEDSVEATQPTESISSS